MARDQRPPPECAVCGADIPPGARACPECGADERTGWREQDVYDGIDLPDEAFTDVRTPTGGRPVRRGIAWYWWVTGLALLIAFIIVTLGLG